MYAAIEHLAKHLNDLHPDAAEAERQHVCAEQHHGANLWLRQRLTNPTGVAANKIELELIQSVARNANVREFTKPRRNAIHDGITVYDFFHNFARCQNARLRDRRNLDCFATDRYRSELRKRNALALEFHSCSLVGKRRDGKELPIGRMCPWGAGTNEKSEKGKGQVETRPGPLGEPPTINNQPLLTIFWPS